MSSDQKERKETKTEELSVSSEVFKKFNFPEAFESLSDEDLKTHITHLYSAILSKDLLGLKLLAYISKSSKISNIMFNSRSSNLYSEIYNPLVLSLLREIQNSSGNSEVVEEKIKKDNGDTLMSRNLKVLKVLIRYLTDYFVLSKQSFELLKLYKPLLQKIFEISFFFEIFEKSEYNKYLVALVSECLTFVLHFCLFDLPSFSSPTFENHIQPNLLSLFPKNALNISHFVSTRLPLLLNISSSEFTNPMELFGNSGSNTLNLNFRYFSTFVKFCNVLPDLLKGKAGLSKHHDVFVQFIIHKLQQFPDSLDLFKSSMEFLSIVFGKNGTPEELFPIYGEKLMNIARTKIHEHEFSRYVFLLLRNFSMYVSTKGKKFEILSFFIDDCKKILSSQISSFKNDRICLAYFFEFLEGFLKDDAACELLMGKSSWEFLRFFVLFVRSLPIFEESCEIERIPIDENIVEVKPEEKSEKEEIEGEKEEEEEEDKEDKEKVETEEEKKIREEKLKLLEEEMKKSGFENIEEDEDEDDKNSYYVEMFPSEKSKIKKSSESKKLDKRREKEKIEEMDEEFKFEEIWRPNLTKIEDPYIVRYLFSCFRILSFRKKLLKNFFLDAPNQLIEHVLSVFLRSSNFFVLAKLCMEILCDLVVNHRNSTSEFFDHQYKIEPFVDYLFERTNLGPIPVRSGPANIYGDCFRLFLRYYRGSSVANFNVDEDDEDGDGGVARVSEKQKKVRKKVKHYMKNKIGGFGIHEPYVATEQGKEYLKDFKDLKTKTVISQAGHKYRVIDDGMDEVLYPEKDTKKCQYCKVERAVKRCSRCRDRFYCSRECQVTDWKNHKADCKKME